MFKDATSSESEDLLRTAEPNERINFLASAQRQYDDADDSDDNNETVAEEGVRGWLVVFASFICIAVLDGVGYTTGLLLNSLLTDLGGSRAEVSITGSLQVGIYCLSGPLVGRLVTEFGTRYVCMAGALVACLGMILASFGQSLGAVLVGYSGFAGVGFGLMYIPSVVGAAPFFNKRRSLAIGICLCGSGIGTFTLAPICEAILSRYGWRWVFRTFGALCLGNLYY
ncbi:monocarboxylate transporter 13 [Eurytemora carolleeae]|uniref:monocarboxylate transporter 13 n=1 Tax=Eurytemora carolleeae TaxID=1294199 RepID=UPI000C78F90B|nr:monocarboxylate transporter 13 [Eurytemora carolleeae]|eukprot:XP_023341260.1 monocarboxylate transporter 13-like [Eurytemora affinis]